MYDQLDIEGNMGYKIKAYINIKNKFILLFLGL